MDKPVYRVSQINAYVRRMLAQDVTLSNLRLTGEISNFKRHSSGHLYFALKDENAALGAVMFSADASSLRFFPKEGQKVIAQGSISLYEKTGQYQFYVRRMEPDGVGALYQAYEALKQKLLDEGLFNAERKRPLPAYPHTVAIVTSPTGAAVRDMIQIARRRHSGIRLVVVPVLVQGDQAAASIAGGIRLANEKSGADTVIVGRGGGSMEDLWAFNEEIVVRAVASSRIPIVSAVGHETDFTLTDLAADLRAPTPSAAAELAVPRAADILQTLETARSRQSSALRRRTEQESRLLEQMFSRPVYRKPDQILEPRRQELDIRLQELIRLKEQRLLNDRSALNALHIRLSYLNPENPLKRGYALVYAADGRVIASAAKVKPGDAVRVRLADGAFGARAEQIQEESDGSEINI